MLIENTNKRSLQNNLKLVKQEIIFIISFYPSYKKMRFSIYLAIPTLAQLMSRDTAKQVLR